MLHHAFQQLHRLFRLFGARIDEQRLNVHAQIRGRVFAQAEAPEPIAVTASVVVGQRRVIAGIEQALCIKCRNLRQQRRDLIQLIQQGQQLVSIEMERLALRLAGQELLFHDHVQQRFPQGGKAPEGLEQRHALLF